MSACTVFFGGGGRGGEGEEGEEDLHIDTSCFTSPGAWPELMRPTSDVLVASSDITSGEESG